MRLTYKATNENGKIVQGIIDAKNVQEAAAYLRSKELLPIRIAEKHERSILAYIPILNKSRGDLVLFTRQLSSMINSGLTLMQALKILEDEQKNERMKDVIKNIITDVEDGTPFSKAIEKFPEIFSSTYIALMSAAESSGLIDKILLRLAENLEKEAKLRSTVRGALIYPVVVIVGIIGVCAIMMIVVVPEVTPLYKGLNVELPLPTKILVAVSNVTIVAWPFLLVGIGLTWFLFSRWHKTETGKLVMDNLILKIPVFGALIRDSALTEITRTFGLLSSAGILVVEGLRQTAETASNILYKNALTSVSQSVEKGITIGEAMETIPLFSPIIVQMVKVGEQTGKLDDSLLRVSGYYEQEVDQRVKNLTTLMEPFIIGVLGVIVGFLLFAVISPMYSLLSAF